jgi:hypothetical protein
MATIYNYFGDDQPIFLDFYLGEAEDVDLSLATLYQTRLVRVSNVGAESIIDVYSAARTGTTQRITSFIPGGIVQKGNKYYVQSLVTFSFDPYPIPGAPIYFYVR